MECNGMREKLSPYLEGLVSPEEKRLIEEHLLSCRQCAGLIEDLKRTVVLVKNLDEVEPPPWFTQKIMARVRAEQERKKTILNRLFYPLRVKIPIQAVATVLIAVAVVYVFKGMEPEIEKVEKPSVIERQAPGDKPPRLPLDRKEELQAPVSEPMERGGLPVPEVHKSSPVESPLQPSPARKREAIGEGDEQAATRDEPVRPQAFSKERAAVPAPTMEEKGKAAKSGKEGYLRERRALGASAQVKADMTKEVEPLDVTVTVKERERAKSEVERLLILLGAERVEKTSLKASELITAKLQTERIKELMEKLRHIGEVEEKGKLFVPSGVQTPVKIEIVSDR